MTTSVQWKDIKGYEGLYQISNTGVVAANSKTVMRGFQGAQHMKSKVLKPQTKAEKSPYQRIQLHDKNGNVKHYYVHRLVAEAFLPNPDNLPEVNHKDKNPRNNHVDNLEWCTRQYNAEYSKAKRVIQFLESGTTKEWKSAAEAARETGVTYANIFHVLSGKRSTAGGYRWAYA